jgi:polysaccharide biosynthesis transport protein
MSIPAQTEPHQTSAAPGGEMLDLGALWQAIKARKHWIIGPTVLALVGTFALVNLISPRFTGEARLLLENRENFYTRANQDVSSSQQIDSEAVQSQVQLIMSRDLAREAIKQVGLVGNAEFDPNATTLNAVKKALVLFGLAPHPADASPEERIFEKFYERLLVFPVGRSRIVSVEFTSENPALAAKGANVIADTYLRMLEGAKKESARGASSWLASTIDPLRIKVSEAEAKVEEYRARSGLLVGTNNTTISSQQLADMSGQLASARTQQVDSQAKARMIRDAIKQGRTFEIPDVANNDLVRRLIEQRINLRAQLASESRTLMSEHPRIKELNAQLNDMEGQIRAAAERTVRTLENDARIASSRVDSLLAVLDGQKQTVASANESEVQLRALEREAKVQRDQLEQYLAKFREASARDSLNATPADARVVSRAIEPVLPSFPKKVPTILVVTLATFMIALACVVARAFFAGQAIVVKAGETTQPGWRRTAASADFDSEFKDDPNQTDQQRRERVAGLITHSGRVAQLRFDTGDAEANVQQVLGILGPPSVEGARRILALDGMDGSGFSALTLARAFAVHDHTMLVDLSATSPRNAPGFSELLAGEASFSDIIQPDEAGRLHLIHAGHAGRDAVIAAIDLLDVAFEALSATYDHVVIVASASDTATVLAPLVAHVEAALVIAGQMGNGFAVEAAYRLTDIMPGPIALVLTDPVEETMPSLAEVHA